MAATTKGFSTHFSNQGARSYPAIDSGSLFLHDGKNQCIRFFRCTLSTSLTQVGVRSIALLRIGDGSRAARRKAAGQFKQLAVLRQDVRPLERLLMAVQAGLAHGLQPFG